MKRLVKLPDGVRVEAGNDPVHHLVQLVLLPPHGDKPIATIGITVATTVALCARLMAAAEQLDDIAEKQGLRN